MNESNHRQIPRNCVIAEAMMATYGDYFSYEFIGLYGVLHSAGMMQCWDWSSSLTTTPYNP